MLVNHTTVAKYSAVGLLLLSTWSASNMLWNKHHPSAELHDTVAKSITEADPSLLRTLVSMENLMGDIDRIAFIRMVDAADRLVFLRELLQNKKVIPSIQDRVDGYIIYNNCWNNIRRSKKSTDRSRGIPVKNKMEIQRLFELVTESIDNHVGAIMLLTQEYFIQ